MHLTDLLIADGVLEVEVADEVLRYARTYGGSLDTNLLETALVDEDQLLPYLERVYTLRNHVDPYAEPQAEALALLRPEQAERYRVVPMRLHLRALDVLVADPTNVRALDEVAFITGCRLIASVACECRVAERLFRGYRLPLPERLGALLAGQRVRKEEMDHFLARRRANRKPLPLDDTAPLQLRGVPDLELSSHAPPEGSHGEIRRSYDQLAGKLESCGDIDEIPAIVLPYLQVLLSRVVLFVVTHEVLRGWDARGPRLRREVVELIKVKLTRPSVFTRVIESGRPFEGAMPQDDVEEDLLIRLAGQCWPEHALVIPVRLRDRVAAILYGEAQNGELLLRAREAAAVIADLAGEAISRLSTPTG